MNKCRDKINIHFLSAMSYVGAEIVGGHGPWYLAVLRVCGFGVDWDNFGLSLPSD